MGITLSKLKSTALIVGLLADLSTLTGFIILNYPIILEAFVRIPFSIILIFVVTISIAVILAQILWGNRSILDPKFKHLKVYYSNENDSPKNESRPNRPYYIVNNISNQAYHIPDFIAQYVRNCNISWSTYSDKETLHEYFASQNISLNAKDASDEELGLWFLPNRNLVAAEYKLKPDLLTELEKLKAKAKLKHYQIIFLYPKYCWFLRFRKVEETAWPPSKRILANFSTMEAFAAPRESMDLHRNRIIGLDGCTPRPIESISKWCKRAKGLTYKYRTFTVEEFLEEHQ